MKSTFKKILAVALAVMMLAALSVTAFAEGTAKDTYKGNAETITSGNSITIVKSIVMFNTDGSEVREPNITFTYNVTPMTEAELTSTTVTGSFPSPGSGTATVKVNPGVANGVTGCSIEFKDTYSKVAASKDGTEVEKTGTLTVTISDDTFKKAGIYRYKITESTNPNDITTVGLDTRDSTYDATRYLDVYIGNKDNGTLELTGAVIFKTTQTDTNKKGSDSITTDFEKTTGYEPAKSESDSSYKYENDTNVDKYHTFNLTVSKTTAGTLADKTNDFPFEITLTGTNSSAIKVDHALTGATYEGTQPATDGGVSVSTTATVLKPKMSNGDSIKITGLPTGTSVTVKETNNTPDVYTPSVTTNTGLTTAPTLTFEETSATNLGANKYVVTSTATLTDKTQNTAIGLTNTIEEISPTGVVLRVAPYALMLGFGLFLVAFSRRRKEENEA